MTQKVVSEIRLDRRIKYKKGERKCYLCKYIFPLTKEFFYPHNTKGFRWACRKCEIPHTAKQHSARNRSFRVKLIKDRNFKCEECGFKNLHPSFFEFDHIVPVLTEKRNALIYDKHLKQMLCPNCHKLKTIKEREAGFFSKNKKQYV